MLSEDHFTLLHNYGYYTLNHFPDGDKLAITASNKVEAMHHHMMNMNASNTAGKTTVKIPTGKHVTKQPADWTTGPEKTIVMQTKPGLKFDQETITVRAGAKIKFTFKNNDDMLHNIVFTKPGAGDKVGELAVKMGLKGERLNFIPSSPDILFHTILLHPKEHDTIYFTAPQKAGEYPYICTYPGHYLIMKGILKVVER